MITTPARTLPYPTIGATIATLPEVAAFHARTTSIYHYLDQVTKATVAAAGMTEPDAQIDLGPLGILQLPYTKMGAIDTLDSFGLDELMIFAYYWKNRHRYRRTADIGGNIGVHSIMMARCGWVVETYEPDPHHVTLLRRNLGLNDATTVHVHEAAVSNRTTQMEFVRVLGNTTSSHLAGAKNNAYGELERFPVKVDDIKDIAPQVDFMKVDAEGEEKNIIVGIAPATWAKLDVMLEVGNAGNADAIFHFAQTHRLHAFAQRLGWQEVTALGDMPVSYKDGSLFLTGKPVMNWS